MGKRKVKNSLPPAALEKKAQSKRTLLNTAKDRPERRSFDLSFVAEKDTPWKALRLNGFRVLRNLYFCFSALFSSHFRTPI